MAKKVFSPQQLLGKPRSWFCSSCDRTHEKTEISWCVRGVERDACCHRSGTKLILVASVIVCARRKLVNVITRQAVA
ncbi:MAG: hypothetical protein ABII72_03060 [Parcubacteria group bacterium]